MNFPEFKNQIVYWWSIQHSNNNPSFRLEQHEIVDCKLEPITNNFIYKFKDCGDNWHSNVFLSREEALGWLSKHLNSFVK